MKYKVSGHQSKIIAELNLSKVLKEQDYINQSFSPNGLDEIGNLGEKTAYEVNITIRSDISESNPEMLDDNSFFRTALEDIKSKVEEAFNTKEYLIHSISNRERGKIDPSLIGE